MYFTREPIVETVITSKEGYKLALKNSKASGYEEYLVDAVEVIAFGHHCFYRSLEKSKSFILPVSDYEILEVRETKMILKTPTVEKGIKIGGGREANVRPPKEEKVEEKQPVVEAEEANPVEQNNEKKRERRRFRKRKEEPLHQGEGFREEKISLIPPPATLISETISRYKDLPVFAGAFFDREEKQPGMELEQVEVGVEKESFLEPVSEERSEES